MKKIISRTGILLVLFSMLGVNAEARKSKPMRTVTTTTTTTIVTTTTPAQSQQNVRPKRDVEIVFVLDTTGSMGGLIDSAKRKIWGIVNEILQNQGEGSKVKIGLVAYRDKEDDYVTKITQLNENLDEVYSELMNLKAAGGGDEPEHVRRALHEGINSIQWSKSRRDLTKIMYLVGDARPHTDYKDYPTTVVTAKKAKQKGIIINTIQCGNLRRTEEFWRNIAQYAGGEYFRIAQDGGSQVVETPYDMELSKLSGELDEKYIPYGKEQKAALRQRAVVAEKMEYASSEAKAERAVNKSLNKYAYSSDDLVQAIENKKIKLSDVKEENLPEQMQKMSLEEREAYVNKILEERKAIKGKISEVSKQREQYIKENTKENKDSFDASVSESLKKQIK